MVRAGEFSRVRRPPRAFPMRKLYICAFACILAASEERAHAQLNPAPTRVVGHTRVDLVSVSPNLAEARDLFSPSAVAVDTSASPPALYVADTGNNRVLGWRNASALENGQPADIVVGQRDFNATLPQGPGTNLSVGLSSPVALAVDAQGNLYVADAGNNRILRFPRPFQQADTLKQPDMVLGQPNFSTRDANNGGLSERSILLTSGAGVLRSGLLFDPNGNLWFSDAGNNRVLRFPREVLQAGRNQPSANAVLGQASFTTRAAPPTDPREKRFLSQPSALAFDSSGRLFVCDLLNRVVVYASPTNLAIADRIMGVIVLQQPGQTAPTSAVNNISLGRQVGNANRPPEGVFVAGGTPFVVDTVNNRILRYDPYESWPPESTQFSPTARQVIGQADFSSFRANRNQAEPNALGFDNPLSAVVAQGNVYLVDSGNHRVMVFPVQNGTITQASRVVGQSEFFQGAPNNMDGREMFLFGGFVSLGGGANSSDGAGVAVDTSSTPPRLYVSDTYNHRILCYRDARSVKQGDAADLVIGQRDLKRALVNDPSNDPDQITETGLRSREFVYRRLGQRARVALSEAFRAGRAVASRSRVGAIELFYETDRCHGAEYGTALRLGIHTGRTFAGFRLGA
jgi:sugar lactone lactonase YvrE